VIQQKEKSNLINWEIVSVNPNNKIWNWKDLFCYWGANIQSIIGFSEAGPHTPSIINSIAEEPPSVILG